MVESLNYAVAGWLMASAILAPLSAQVTIKDKTGDEGRILLVADNVSGIPYTLTLNLRLKNMKTAKAVPKHYVIPGGAMDFPLTELIAGKGKYSYRVGYETHKGINTGHRHDDDFIYSLPVAAPYQIIQGYFGKFSHLDKKAIDFKVPEGSDVLAAREGIVMEVKINGKSSCLNPGCEKEGNFIKILHQDGSVASYYHLKYRGSLVEVGQSVQKGQIIGKSGNTGYSSEPHLHFEVYSLHNDQKKYYDVNFDTGNGQIIAGKKLKPKS